MRAAAVAGKSPSALWLQGGGGSQLQLQLQLHFLLTDRARKSVYRPTGLFWRTLEPILAILAAARSPPCGTLLEPGLRMCVSML